MDLPQLKKTQNLFPKDLVAKRYLSLAVFIYKSNMAKASLENYIATYEMINSILGKVDQNHTRIRNVALLIFSCIFLALVEGKKFSNIFKSV